MCLLGHFERAFLCFTIVFLEDAAVCVAMAFLIEYVLGLLFDE